MRNKWMVPGVILVLTATLSGCATTPRHGCPLDHGLGCHTLPQAYAASRTGGGNVQSVFGQPAPVPGAGAAVSEAAAPSVLDPSSQGYPQAGPGGTPVWTPGQVYRAWTAPWTDAEGYLHSGGYVYFTTPGHWSYGTLQSNGPGAGILHPISPSQLGFQPDTGRKRPLPNQRSSSVDGATRSAMNYLNGGITQPQEQMTPQ